MSAAEAFAAAQLDELYQIERWGDGSDSRRSGTRASRRDIEAGARFLALLGNARLKG